MKRYPAHWSWLLIVSSTFLSLLCLWIGWIGLERTGGGGKWLATLPILLAAACSLFCIRAYTITPEAILVHRLLWTTEVPRLGLKSAQYVPHAMRRSIRTFGNGGFFSFSGFYWNKVFGAYRAFVTDPAKTVVLQYASKRTVLLSPDVPEEFVRALNLQFRS